MHVTLYDTMGILINFLKFTGKEDALALRQSFGFYDECTGFSFGFWLEVGSKLMVFDR